MTVCLQQALEPVTKMAASMYEGYLPRSIRHHVGASILVGLDAEPSKTTDSQHGWFLVAHHVVRVPNCNNCAKETTTLHIKRLLAAAA